MSKYELARLYEKSKKLIWGVVASPVFFILVFICVACIAYYLIRNLQGNQNNVANKAAIIQTAIVAIGLFSVMIAALQVRVTATWNKVLSYHSFFGELVTPAIRAELEATADECKFTECIRKGSKIGDAAASAIVKDAKHDAVVACYLDEFEEFCGAVNAGIVDKDYAYLLEASRVMRVWDIFQTYVRLCRSSGAGGSDCYVQIENLAAEWKERRLHEDTQKAKVGRMRSPF